MLKQQRPAGVAVVGGEGLAAGQPVDQIGIYRPDKRLAAVNLLFDLRLMFEEPGQLGCREIGVDLKPGLLLYIVVVSRFDQRLADGVAAPALPDDGVVQRFAGHAVEDDNRLTLVGDAQAQNIIGRGSLPFLAVPVLPRGYCGRFPRHHAQPSPAVDNIAYAPA